LYVPTASKPWQPPSVPHPRRPLVLPCACTPLHPYPLGAKIFSPPHALHHHQDLTALCSAPRCAERRRRRVVLSCLEHPSQLCRGRHPFLKRGPALMCHQSSGVGESFRSCSMYVSASTRTTSAGRRPVPPPCPRASPSHHVPRWQLKLQLSPLDRSLIGIPFGRLHASTSRHLR
jgi:hypothetical protein